MSAYREFFNAFLNLNEIKNYLKLFLEILPSPTAKTMYIVEHGHSVNPFRFMAFGYSIYFLIIVSEPLLSGKFSFADSIIQMLVGLILYFVFATVQYKILKDVSPAARTFDNYLVMSSIVGGMFYLLIGTAAIVVLFSQAFGLLLLLGTMIYFIFYGLKTSKRFWEISYGKIFLYSFLSSIAATVALVVVVLLLSLVFGLYLYSEQIGDDIGSSNVGIQKVHPPEINGNVEIQKAHPPEINGNVGIQNIHPTEIHGSVKVTWFVNGFQFVGILTMFGTYGTMRTTFVNPTSYINK